MPVRYFFYDSALRKNNEAPRKNSTSSNLNSKPPNFNSAASNFYEIPHRKKLCKNRVF